MILNPSSPSYTTLKTHLISLYTDSDTYFPEDAIVMERNSRSFRKRVPLINANAEAVADLLKASQLSDPGLVKEVYYPKWTTTDNYLACRVPNEINSNNKTDDIGAGAYGGLLSITFHSPLAASAFFDSLAVYKGPSLGTNFTLACPYVILAHYNEMEWVRSLGVEEELVRISVGVEERGKLVGVFETALEAARDAAARGR